MSVTVWDVLGAVTAKEWFYFAGIGLALLVLKVLAEEMRGRPRATGRPAESPFEHRLLGLIDGAGLARPETQYFGPGPRAPISGRPGLPRTQACR